VIGGATTVYAEVADINIKNIASKEHGYKFKHFKSIVYLMTGKIDFSKVNKFCQPT